MFKRLVEWVLSKMFPLNKSSHIELSKGVTYHGKSTSWERAKEQEISTYYGGHWGGYDGTTRRNKL